MRWQNAIFVLALAAVGAVMSLRADEAAPRKPLPAGKACQGTLYVNDKTYKLEHAVGYDVKLYGNDAFVLLLSDRAIPVDTIKSVLAAGNGSDDRLSLFQSHVKVNFDKEGKPLSCSTWAANSSFSASGSKELKGDFAIKEGRVRGSTSYGPVGEPGKKKGFDATFDAVLLPNPAAKAAPKIAEQGEPKSESATAPKPAKNAAVSVRDLPIPKDATDVEYKQLVGHIGFKSKSDVKTLSAALAKSFKQQGWKADDDDLVTPASAILNRKKGAAELTLFVKPDGAGSKVTIMSAGLAWGEEDTADVEDK
jgi:hypothetical protein